MLFSDRPGLCSHWQLVTATHTHSLTHTHAHTHSRSHTHGVPLHSWVNLAHEFTHCVRSEIFLSERLLAIYTVATQWELYKTA